LIARYNNGLAPLLQKVKKELERADTVIEEDTSVLEKVRVEG
jgi:hypothetical protein